MQASVAKSTHAGIPWLRFIHRSLGDRVHFWPFDGWDIPIGKSVVLEAYPKLWSAAFPAGDRTADQHDAYSIAAWLAQAKSDGSLSTALRSSSTAFEAAVAHVEGWIVSVPGEVSTKSKQPTGRSSGLAVAPKRKTTAPGYVNQNGQEVFHGTGQPGNDHNQVVYVLKCKTCGHRYGANGSDIWQRRCPSCGGDAAELEF